VGVAPGSRGDTGKLQTDPIVTVVAAEDTGAARPYRSRSGDGGAGRAAPGTR
jgi:hypothetical protein